MVKQRAGFSLLEVVISVAIFTSIMLMLSYAVQANARQTNVDMAQFEASAAARRIMQQIVRELQDTGAHSGGADKITPTRAAGGSNVNTLVFRRRIAMTGNEGTDWEANPITYQLVTSPGEVPGDNDDDDRDGVFDERRLVRSHAAILGGAQMTMDDSVTLFRIDRVVGSDLVTVSLEVSRGYARKGQSTLARDTLQLNEWARARLVTNVLLRNRP